MRNLFYSLIYFVYNLYVDNVRNLTLKVIYTFTDTYFEPYLTVCANLQSSGDAGVITHSSRVTVQTSHDHAALLQTS